MLRKWDNRSLAEVSYAFMKAGVKSIALFDVIRPEIVRCGVLTLDGRQLGNLAVAFHRM